MYNEADLLSRVCVFYIDSGSLNDVSKIWIPYSNPVTGANLWYPENQSDINDYVTGWEGSWDPAKTLYMSWVQDIKDQIQLLIPPALVKPEGALGLTAVCKATVDELPDKDTVNYDDWQNNIGGDRGPQVDYKGDPL